MTRDLKALNQAGFIQFRQDEDVTRGEERREEQENRPLDALQVPPPEPVDVPGWSRPVALDFIERRRAG